MFDKWLNEYVPFWRGQKFGTLITRRRRFANDWFMIKYALFGRFYEMITGKDWNK